ncbi:antibiotic ABC transporter ATP-binding protein, partial [Streptomyces sp. SID6041]|nr:antibiotic ABC transporter ATP-binding protein [Streptomyces sp. SID6041]
MGVVARVVLVHGIAQQYEGPETLGLKLGAALRDGVKLATGTALEPEDVACAFFGSAFIEEGTRAADLPPWDEKHVRMGFEAELLDAWFQRAAKLEASIPSLDEEGTRNLTAAATSRALQVEWVRTRLHGLARSGFFKGLDKRVLVGELRQVTRYLDEPPTWQAARRSVAELIGQDTRVIVAHSLGSVVAYEALCENP